MIIDQIGILPSGFLPKSIGRLIDGWEAKDTSKQINEPYKKGIDNKVKPRILRYEKKMNSTVAWIPTKIDIPTPIFFSLFYWILLQMQIRNQTRQIDQWLKRVVNWNKISKCFSFGFRWVPSIIGEEKKKRKIVNELEEDHKRRNSQAKQQQRTKWYRAFDEVWFENFMETNAIKFPYYYMIK